MRIIDVDALINEIKKETEKAIEQDDGVGAFWLGYFAGLVIEQPTIQPEPHYDEWCTGCKEYDQKRHNCPRWNKVIKQTLKDIEPQEGHWKRVSASAYRTYASYIYRCDNCGEDNWHDSNFCPNCGADMRGEKDG